MSHPDSIRFRRTNIAIVDKLNNSDNLMVSNLSTIDDKLVNTVKHTVSSPQFLDSLQQSLVSGPFIAELCKQIASSPVFVDLITSMVSSTLKQQQEEICRLQKTVDDFDETVADLKDQVDKLELKCDRLEQYNKRKNLIIHGVPETQNENTDKIAVEVAKITGHILDEKFIYSSHRLPSKMINAPRPIVVSFLRYSDRQAIIKNRRKLRQYERYKTTFINEHLNSLNNNLFHHARHKLIKHGVYSRNGNVLYIDAHMKIHLLTSYSIIDQLALRI
ncbi:unnamed protein product [Didymodactylos carnosus]|uniref:Uncharacterized protein n=1 Tax=Didymodactylos carnosus TaxID=1234261 RepID=A0A815VXX3_9BILA|nr:unnamed protein product [Didymodactylos carnosus]CAF1537957.1 unnamed protein product [Didymodactylos carnosus]CAF3646271.1 unnamed protein product [Didymodactylos carnosus]CAF4397954.1 unnamed protein product [Didymodactylos carnosus]